MDFLQLAGDSLQCALATGVLKAIAGWGWLQDHFEGLPGPLTTAIFATIVAFIVLRVNLAINIRNKRMDIILHCNMRYDELYKMRMDIEDQNDVNLLLQNRKSDAYFKRYWGLKSDQLDYWFSGYIDPETISSWFMFTANSIRKNTKIGGHSYALRWESDKEDHEVVNQRLVEIMEFVIKYASKIYDDHIMHAVILEYLRIVEGNERILIKQLSRNTPKRLSIKHFMRTLRPGAMQDYDKFDTSGAVSSRFNIIIRKLYHLKFMKKPMPRKRSKVRFDQLRAMCASVIAQQDSDNFSI